MTCQICKSGKTVGKCIICEKEVCTSCVVYCDLKDTDICSQKAGTIVVWRCPAIYCPKDGKEALIFTCKDCNTTFCKTPIDRWAKACPTCKDYICGNCYEEHIKTCTVFYDKEKALDKLYKLVEGDKKEKSDK